MAFAGIGGDYRVLPGSDHRSALLAEGLVGGLRPREASSLPAPAGTFVPHSVSVV